MNVELAHWLTEYQPLLMPRWVAAVTIVSPTNGHSTELLSTDGASIPLDDQRLVLGNLEAIYAGLVQAARGDWRTLDTHLHAICHAANARTLGLPNLLQMTFQLRQLAWELFARETHDAAQTVALMNALQPLLDHTVDVLTRAWAHATEEVIAARMEEAEFMTQSMNSATEQADEIALNLSRLNELSQRLSASLESSDTSEIIGVVGSELLDILEVAHVTIWMPDEERQRATSEVVLHAVASWGEAAQDVAGMRITPVLDETWPNDMVLHAYMLSQPVLAIDEPPTPSIQGDWYLADCGAVALPLLVKDRALGVVLLQDWLPSEHLSASHQNILRAVVNQASIALDNAHLYAQVRRFNSDLEQLIDLRTRELQAEKDRLRTLHDISVEVGSTLDLDSLLNTSLQALARIAQVEFGSIMLVDRETDHLVNRAVLGQDVVNTFTRFPLGFGVAGWVALHKRPALIADVTNDERWEKLPTAVLVAEEDAPRKAQGSMVSVPLIAHNETLGVLTLSHEQPRFFNEDHLRLLTASAGAIAIGIHNANLYNEIVFEMEKRGELLRYHQMESSQIEAILQSLSDGVLVCDPDGSVLSANPACGTILGKNVEDLVLSDLHSILRGLLGHRVDELPLDELLDRPIGANHQRRIFESTVQIGTHIVSLTLGPVVKDDGELVGALLVLHDKTREVESERLKTEFIGTMSHELRTPMTAVKGFTQLLVMGSLGTINDTQREFLHTIQTNADRMISIINDVMELTKIETGSIDLELRPLHLAEALSGVVSELQPLVTQRQHALTISIPPGLPLVRADTTRLRQVLYNLVTNAIKYTPHGGDIRVEANEATVEDLPQNVRDSLPTDRRYTRIDVHDTGVGIAEHELEHIFERFYRTENPLKVEAGGTGLGLSLTRPLVELLGGRIWVTSTLGEGSTFSFILPAV